MIEMRLIKMKMSVIFVGETIMNWLIVVCSKLTRREKQVRRSRFLRMKLRKMNPVTTAERQDTPSMIVLMQPRSSRQTMYTKVSLGEVFDN